MPSEEHPRSTHADVEQQAAAWLSRRDRGLTSAEQDEYLQWLREDPRHGPAYTQCESTLRRLIQLRLWQPAQSTEPNPDLFAPPRRRFSHWRSYVLATAAIIAISIGIAAWDIMPKPQSHRPVPRTVLITNECQTLPDGSVVELKEGSSISTEYTEAERRVHLIGGTALFTVAKNPARPFVVEADGVTIRAVGTAFAVQLKKTGIEVLVTEGRVSLGQLAVAVNKSPSINPVEKISPAPKPPLPIVSAGERATVTRALSDTPPVVIQVTPEEIKEELAWQKPQLQFYETPLIDALREFNRHNKRQLVLGEASLGAIPIGGSFRVDNIEGFARLLEATLGLQVELQDPDKITLYRAK